MFLSVSLQEMGDNSSEGLKLESFNLNIVNTHTITNYLIPFFEYIEETVTKVELFNDKINSKISKIKDIIKNFKNKQNEKLVLTPGFPSESSEKKNN